MDNLLILRLDTFPECMGINFQGKDNSIFSSSIQKLSLSFPEFLEINEAKSTKSSSIIMNFHIEYF